MKSAALKARKEEVKAQAQNNSAKKKEKKSKRHRYESESGSNPYSGFTTMPSRYMYSEGRHQEECPASPLLNSY